MTAPDPTSPPPADQAPSLPPVSPTRRRLSRLVVLAIFLGAGGLGYWLYWSGPQSSEVVFVLTDVEVADNGALLRHEHVVSLRCRVMDEAGEVLATVRHRRPGAVTPGSELRLPAGRYLLHVELKLRRRNGTLRTMRYLKNADLRGEKVTIHL